MVQQNSLFDWLDSLSPLGTIFIKLNTAAFVIFFLIREQRLFEGGVYSRTGV